MSAEKTRITVGLSADVVAIIEAERQLHPGLSTSELVEGLIRRGHPATVTPRNALVRSLAGGERFPLGERADLRNDWQT